MRGSPPLVSVVIPTYNRGRYIEQTVESALRQTYPRIEVVVLDDGSTDDTPTRLTRFGSRIRYVRQDNQGVAKAMNAAVRLSQGEFFVVLGDDDLLMPEMVSVQAAVLSAHPHGAFVCSGVWFIDEHGRRIKESTAGRLRRCTLADLLEDNFVWHCSAMVRRSYFEEVGGFDPELDTTQDYDLWVRLARRYEFFYTPQPLACWRSHAGNTSRRLDEWLEDHLIVYDKLRRDGGLSPWAHRRHRARVYFKFGWHYGRAGRLAEARRCFRTAVRLMPWVGIEFWPPETQSRRWTFFYRLLYPMLNGWSSQRRFAVPTPLGGSA